MWTDGVDLWAFALSNAIRNLKFYDTRAFRTPPNRDIDQLPFGIDKLRDYCGQFIRFERLLIDQEPGAHEILEDTEITTRLKSGSRP